MGTILEGGALNMLGIRTRNCPVRSRTMHVAAFGAAKSKVSLVTVFTSEWTHVKQCAAELFEFVSSV
jgi:hypothetical protein